MSQQSEKAKQLLLAVTDLLQQSSWDHMSLIEKEQVKRKLTDAFDHLFSISSKVVENEPLFEAKEAIIVPLVSEKREKPTLEIPVMDNTSLIEQTQEPVIQTVHPFLQEQQSDPEILPEIELAKSIVNADEEDEKQKASLNERFMHEKTTLADRILRPQGSLKTSIDVNEKFFFIRDLFGADGNAYDKAIRFLDNLSSMDDAIIYIERELAIQYKWEPISKAREKFMKQVASRFGR